MEQKEKHLEIKPPLNNILTILLTLSLLIFCTVWANCPILKPMFIVLLQVSAFGSIKKGLAILPSLPCILTLFSNAVRTLLTFCSSYLKEIKIKSVIKFLWWWVLKFNIFDQKSKAKEIILFCEYALQRMTFKVNFYVKNHMNHSENALFSNFSCMFLNPNNFFQFEF